MSKFKTVEVKFEDYKFYVMIEYIDLIFKIKIKDRILTTIHTNDMANKQDFFHIRNVFEYGLKLGEHDRDIKNNLKQEIPKSIILLTGLFILSISILIWI